MAVNWALLNENQVNPVNALMQGMKVGGEMRDARQTRNALSMFNTDPQGSINALIAAGHPDDAASLMKIDAGRQSQRALTAAQPFLAKKDYAAAANAASGIDPAVADKIFGMDKSQLDHTKAVGELAAGVLLTAANIPDPVARRQFVMSKQDDLLKYFTPEQLAGLDLNDVDSLRAHGSQFMDLSKIAGTVSLQKAGDYLVGVRESPMGASITSATEVPETRDERLNRERLDHQVSQDNQTNSFTERRIGLEEQDLSEGKVAGRIAAKLAAGQQPSPQEMDWYNAYQQRQMTIAKAAMLGANGGGATSQYGETPPSPAMSNGNRGATNQSASTRTHADPFAGIPEGAVVKQNGRRYRRQGSNFVPVP